MRARASVAALIAGLSLLPSCKDKPVENVVDAAPAAATVMPAASAIAIADEAALGLRRPRMYLGPSSAIFQAARTLELTPEQKVKVDAAEKLAAGGGASTRTAAHELEIELAAAARAGKIDTVKLEPRYATLERLAATDHAAESDALNALHAALDAAQRKAVVAVVRAKQAKGEARRVTKDGVDLSASDGGKARARKAHLERLMRGIDIDAEQQRKVDALVGKDDGKGGASDPAESNKRLEARLAAFEKDAFDATKADPFDAKKKRAALEMESKLLAQVLPILNAEQRDKLAGRMERAGAPRMGHRAGFGRHPSPVESDDDE